MVQSTGKYTDGFAQGHRWLCSRPSELGELGPRAARWLHQVGRIRTLRAAASWLRGRGPQGPRLGSLGPRDFPGTAGRSAGKPSMAISPHMALCARNQLPARSSHWRADQCAPVAVQAVPHCPASRPSRPVGRLSADAATDTSGSVVIVARGNRLAGSSMAIRACRSRSGRPETRKRRSH